MRRAFVLMALPLVAALAACVGEADPLPTQYVIPTLDPARLNQPAEPPTLPPSWSRV